MYNSAGNTIDIYKTRLFDKWAFKEGLSDAVLLRAIQEIQAGLIDAALGGHVVKKRIALPGRGKSGGSRTLLASSLLNLTIEQRLVAVISGKLLKVN